MLEENKLMTPDEFLQNYQEMGPKMLWAITPHPKKSDFILYYPYVHHPQPCPSIPKHKDTIHSIQLKSQIPCYTPPNFSFSRGAWVAEVILKPSDQDEDSEIFGILTAMNEQALPENAFLYPPGGLQQKGCCSCGSPETAVNNMAPMSQKRSSCQWHHGCPIQFPYLYCENGHCHCVARCH